MNPREGQPRLLTTAFAAAIAAHTLDDAVVVRHGANGPDHLHALHAYGIVLTSAVAVAVLAAVGLAAWLGATRGLAGNRAVGPVVALGPLALVQAGLFTALEIAERLAAGYRPADLLHGSLFAIGLLAQVVVAAFAVLLLSLVASGARRIVSENRRRPARPAVVRQRPSYAGMPTTGRRAGVACRGPPGRSPS